MLVKRLDEESYSRVANILEKYIKITDFIKNPYIVVDDNMTYIVCKDKNNYLIACSYWAYEAVLDEQGNVIELRDVDGTCRIINKASDILYNREYSGSDVVCQAFVDSARDNHPRAEFNYSIMREYGGASFVYDLFGHDEDIEAYLYFINSKIPQDIYYKEELPIFNKRLVSRSHFFHIYDDAYTKLKKIGSWHYSTRLYNDKELLNSMMLDGFDYHVDPVLIDFIVGEKRKSIAKILKNFNLSK